jgi:collagen type VII alpha
VTGATGPQGPAGPTGAAGSTGAIGATGSSGAVGMNFRGAWTTSTNYAVNDAVTYSGSTYLAQSSGANFEPDLFPSFWTVIAQVGGTGPTGAVGNATTVSVGTVNTLAAGSQATVTNSGTSQAAVLNFGIPQGVQGAAGTGGGGTSSGNFAGVYHAVSFNTTFYSVNLPNASTNEIGTTSTTAVLAWVPAGCTASQLSVYSQQSNTIVVTLRVGTPGSMANSVLSATVSPNSSFTATGSVTIAAGQFIDYVISSASGTSAGVWTALTCQ